MVLMRFMEFLSGCVSVMVIVDSHFKDELYDLVVCLFLI